MLLSGLILLLSFIAIIYSFAVMGKFSSLKSNLIETSAIIFPVGSLVSIIWVIICGIKEYQAQKNVQENLINEESCND